MFKNCVRFCKLYYRSLQKLRKLIKKKLRIGKQIKN